MGNLNLNCENVHTGELHNNVPNFTKAPFDLYNSSKNWRILVYCQKIIQTIYFDYYTKTKA